MAVRHGGHDLPILSAVADITPLAVRNGGQIRPFVSAMADTWILHCDRARKNSCSSEDKISDGFHEISRGFYEFRGLRPKFLRCAQH